MKRTLALTLGCLLLCSRAEAADDCLPVNSPSIEILAERFSLDLEQVVWLRNALASGGLRDPASLEGLPGAGPELREALGDALCWSAPARLRVLAGVRFRESHDEERWSLTGERGNWTVVGRVHRSGSPKTLLERGGARARAGRFTLAVGTLENRQGLGLSIQTAGTEVRGGLPRRRAVTTWTPTPVLDTGVLCGAALSVAPGLWSLSLAAVRALDASRPGCLAFTIGRTNGASGVAGHIAGSNAGRAGSLVLWGTRGSGEWSAEAAAGGEGAALGGAFGLALASWKLRGSLIWTGAGYASPLVSAREDPVEDGGLSATMETRWSGGRGRFIRLLHAVDRRPSKALAAPPACSLANELEWVEPLRPGLDAAFLWRLRRSQPDGTPSERNESQAGQAELRWVRKGFSARLRLEERLGGAGSRSWYVTAGRLRSRLAWEIRAGHVIGETGADSVPLYFRRAGEWSGSTSLLNGTRVGVWMRARSGGWTLESSGDGGGSRWTWSFALAKALGRAS